MTEPSLLRGIVDVFPQIDTRDFFSVPRRVKLGFDPTSDFLHLGHSILLRKLGALQKAGCVPVVIIGDFTAQIGDPTGKQKTRKQLCREEVEANANKFLSVVQRFIDTDAGKCEIVLNSNHLEKLSLREIVSLQSTLTVQQLMAKKDFASRLENQTPISLHEFMYPLLQGYDSFHVQSDVELGGVDQKFNVSVGRDIQEHFGSKTKQVGMLMPILVGTDGIQKMSKSLNNAIGIDEHPVAMFSKLEKVPDCAVDDYVTLLTDCDVSKLSSDPRTRQKQMAFEVVASFHGKDAAAKAQKDAESVILGSDSSGDLPKVSVSSVQFPVQLASLLRDIGLTSSSNDSRRKIASGAVKLNGVKVTDGGFVVGSCDEIKGSTIQLSKSCFYRFVCDG